MAQSKKSSRSKRKKPVDAAAATATTAAPSHGQAAADMQLVTVKRSFFRFKKTKRLRPVKPPAAVPSSWVICKKALSILAEHRWLFLGIAAIYTALNIVLVRGFTGATDLSPLKDLLGSQYSGGVGQLGSSLALFAILVTATGSNASDVAGAYQTFLIVITSLAIVWALRQVMAGEGGIRIRDCFYKGMYPLVPVLLVCLIILAQLIPLLVGGGIYALISTNGIAINGLEQFVGMAIFFLGAGITFYLLASSIFAVYIATLPDMTPLRAYRSARDLVRYRRWSVLRKLLFLPLALLVVTAVIMLPIIWVLTPLAPWIFFLLSMVGIVLIHAYLYTLYRELLA